MHYSAIIVYLVAGDRAKASLGRMTDWLLGHDKLLEIVVGLSLWAVFPLKGLAALA